MTSTAKVLPMPNRDERLLLAKWAEADRLRQRLRELERETRPVEERVRKALGYFMPVSRENLERALLAKEGR